MGRTLETRPRHQQEVCARRQVNPGVCIPFMNDLSGPSRPRHFPAQKKGGYASSQWVYNGITITRECTGGGGRKFEATRNPEVKRSFYGYREGEVDGLELYATITRAKCLIAGRLSGGTRSASMHTWTKYVSADVRT